MSTDVDALANLIRTVDGNHALGAGALAEALIANGVSLDKPVAVIGEVLDNRFDPSSAASFANYQRAASYAALLIDSGDYKAVGLYEKGELTGRRTRHS